MTAVPSRIHAVRWRLPEPPSGAALARLRNSLQAADWEGAGNPSALLVVKTLEVPVDPSRGGSVPDARALRGRLGRAWEGSARPATGRLPGDAEAVRFADEGELLAGFLVARWEGSTHWCWELLRKRRLLSEPWEAALERPFRLLGMLAYLRAWGCLEPLLRSRPPVLLWRAAIALCRALELRRFSAWLSEGWDVPGYGGTDPDPAPMGTGTERKRGEGFPPDISRRPWAAWWSPEGEDLPPEAELLAALALGAWENRTCLDQPWFLGEVQRWRRGRAMDPEHGRAKSAGRSASAVRLERAPGEGPEARGEGTGNGTGVTPRGASNLPNTHRDGPRSPSAPEAARGEGRPPPAPIPADAAAMAGAPAEGDRTRRFPEPNPAGAPSRSVPAKPPSAPARSQAWGETAIDTGWAGVFFLLPLLRRLGWPDRPLPAFPSLGGWVLLEAAAAALAAWAGDDIAAAWESDPLREALLAWSPGESDPGTSREGLRREAIGLLLPILPAAAGAALRMEDPRSMAQELLLRRGRVYRTACHVDVVFPIQGISLAVRRAGLDQDPGWQPWLGRIVGYHFL